MSPRKVAVTAAVLGGLVAWYLFRPERLFINRAVSESFPASAAGQPGAEPLASGRFHGNAHETKGLATVYRLPDGTLVRG